MKGEPRGGLGAALAATNWDDFDVPAIWSMIEDFDAGPQWRHLAGWEKACRLTDLHLTRMRTYRDELAAAWPPERNEASRVYLSEFDKLMSSVQATYEAAVANHGAMSTATSVLIEARDKLRPVYEEWQAKASTMASYDASVAAGSAGLPAPAPGPPPLPPTWREPLNAQAREVMGAASSEIAMAAYRLVTPPGYTAPIVRQDRGSDKELAKLAPFTYPAIPPVMPRAPTRTGASRDNERVSKITPATRSPLLTSAGRRAESSRASSPIDRAVAPIIDSSRKSPKVKAVAPAIEQSRARAPASPPASGRTSPLTGTGPRQISPQGIIGPPLNGMGQVPLVPPQPASQNGVMGGNKTSQQMTSSSQPPRETGRRSTESGYTTADGHWITITRAPGHEPEQRELSEDAGSNDLWSVTKGVPSVITPLPYAPHSPGPAIGLP